MKQIKFLIFTAIALAVGFASCSSDDDDEELIKSSTKTITEFKVGDNAATIDEKEKTITIILSAGTDIKAVKPILKISDKATVSPQSGAEVNLSEPVTYTVTAEDKSKAEYVVTATVAKSTDAILKSFVLTELAPEVKGEIEEKAKTVAVSVPFGTDITKLKPTIGIAGKSVTPTSDAVQDFTKPVKYTVEAEDGRKVEYTVTVTIITSKDAEIESFAFAPLKVEGKIDAAKKTIAVEVPFGTDVKALVPTITYKGHEISPAKDAAQDFTKPVKYTVTAQSGDKVEYTVTVTFEKFVGEITKVSSQYVIEGKKITLSGLFAEKDNKLEFVSEEKKYELKLDSETQTTLVATLTTAIPAGEYTLEVTSYDSKISSTEKVTVLAPDAIYFDSINKTEFVEGDVKLVVTGKNMIMYNQRTLYVTNLDTKFFFSAFCDLNDAGTEMTSDLSNRTELVPGKYKAVLDIYQNKSNPVYFTVTAK